MTQALTDIQFINNATIVFEKRLPQESAADRRRRLRARRAAHCDRAGANARQIELATAARRQVARIACSATWAEDCLYRGRDYAPDFKCQCALCRGEFPDRLHPRPARETTIASDCQVESSEDPEFAEEFARLRNDRSRCGCAFISGNRSDRGSGTSRRKDLAG